MKLNRSEYFKLEWIRDHPGIAYAHVRGKVLDSLVGKDLVKITRAEGQKIDEATVQLTEAGMKEFDDAA